MVNRGIVGNFGTAAPAWVKFEKIASDHSQTSDSAGVSDPCENGSDTAYGFRNRSVMWLSRLSGDLLKCDKSRRREFA
ncbi:hypothetical protein RRSWK_04994 [Rhodopirellula sp. SWK7]|nr:hypothetical protein RRSWK_04994 [Rhodopirellula sp. SWK7]